MPLPLDPASVASYVARAQARTDDGKFSVAQKTTKASYGWSRGVADAIASTLKPRNPTSAVLYSWIAKYRMRTLSGFLVADSAFANQATGLLALAALDAMNTIDLRNPLPQIPNAVSKWPA